MRWTKRCTSLVLENGLSNQFGNLNSHFISEVSLYLRHCQLVLLLVHMLDVVTVRVVVVVLPHEEVRLVLDVVVVVAVLWGLTRMKK